MTSDDTAWKWERGFGFIRAVESLDRGSPRELKERNYFCPRSAIKDGDCLADGSIVRFRPVFDANKGKYRAKDVTGGVQFTWSLDEGLLHALGTAGEPGADWSDPTVTAGVIVTASSIDLTDDDPVCEAGQETQFERFIRRDEGTCSTESEEHSWIMVELPIGIHLTAYSIRDGCNSFNFHDLHLRSWSLLASLDGQQWVTLREHRDDCALWGDFRLVQSPDDCLHSYANVATWDVGTPSSLAVYHRYFKLRMDGPNGAQNSHFTLNTDGSTSGDSHDQWKMCVSGIEFFGVVGEIDTAAVAAVTRVRAAGQSQRRQQVQAAPVAAAVLRGGVFRVDNCAQATYNGYYRKNGIRDGKTQYCHVDEKQKEIFYAAGDAVVHCGSGWMLYHKGKADFYLNDYESDRPLTSGWRCNSGYSDAGSSDLRIVYI